MHGFSDDHTILSISKSIDALKYNLIKESQIAIKWLEDNHMLANPSKFQSILSNKSKESIDTSIVINNSQRLVTLLGLDIDDKLKFDSHISNLCKSLQESWRSTK